MHIIIGKCKVAFEKQIFSFKIVLSKKRAISFQVLKPASIDDVVKSINPHKSNQ